MASGFSLKDQLFNRDKVRYLAGLFSAAEPGFDADSFEEQVMADLPALELKQRMTLIAEVLARHLPEALPEAAPVLLVAQRLTRVRRAPEATRPAPSQRP